MSDRDDELMMVSAPQLLKAVEEMGETGVLVNGVKVTKQQVRKAGEILRDGPQPVCNGIAADMPGFIDKAAQSGKSLTLQVGILPSRIYRIDKLGRARAA